MILQQYKKALLLLISFVFSACSGYSQNTGFVYKPVPANYLQRQVPQSMLTRASQLKTQAFDMTSALPAGHVTDGTVDYTNYLQGAMDAHSLVLMPDFAVLVNDTGLTVNRGQTIIFNTNSSLILKSSNLQTYQILRVYNSDNVYIYFPVITGDKYRHLDSLGQWGMGIDIRASKNVTVVKPIISKCWGDGIYVGQIANLASSNINLIEPMLDDNRRNGLSVTAVKGLKIVGGVLSNSNGQNPKCGFDIEPNRTTDIIDSITVNNTVSFNNASYGMVISLQHLVGRTQGTTTITMANNIDEGSNIGLGIIGKPLTGTLTGSIRLISPKFINNVTMPMRTPFRNYGLKVTLTNPVIEPPAAKL